MQAKVVNRDGAKILVVEVPMHDPILSQTGKAFVVASSHGFVPTAVVVEGKPVAISLNATIRK